MFGKRNRRLALETLLQGEDNVPVIDPQSLALPQLQTAEVSSQELTQSLLKAQDSVVALESLARGLRGEQGKGLNKFGGQCLNLAVEQYIEQAGLPEQSAALDLKLLGDDSAQALTQAGQSLQDNVARVLTLSGEQLVQLLLFLAQKRETIAKQVRALHHRMDEIQEDVDALKASGQEPTLTVSVTLGSHAQYDPICYNSLGVVNKGASVANDLLGLMDGHMALYQRLVHQQSEWLRIHKDNLLDAATGFEQYPFNPADYMLPGMQKYKRLADGQLVLKGGQLPGGMFAWACTTDHPRAGYAAIEGLRKSRFILDFENGAVGPIPKNTPSVDEVQVLWPADIEARLKELRMVLLKLRQWSDLVHKQLWQEAVFEETVVQALLMPASNSIRERAIGQIAGVVVKLLDEAGNNVGHYTLWAAEALVRYMEDSIRVWAPKHADGGAQ